MPRRYPFAPALVPPAESKPGSGMDPVHSPWLSQPDCRSSSWTVHRPACWQTASASAPSQTALCCARHGCCSAPDGHLPDTVPDTTTVPANNAAPCILRISSPSRASAHLPMPIERPEQVSPAPAASNTAVPASALPTAALYETASNSSVRQPLPENLSWPPARALAEPHQTCVWHGPSILIRSAEIL